MIRIRFGAYDAEAKKSLRLDMCTYLGEFNRGGFFILE